MKMNNNKETSYSNMSMSKIKYNLWTKKLCRINKLLDSCIVFSKNFCIAENNFLKFYNPSIHSQDVSIKMNYAAYSVCFTISAKTFVFFDIILHLKSNKKMT